MKNFIRSMFIVLIVSTQIAYAEQTSASDYAGYTNAVRKAYSTALGFKKFKQDPEYTGILEHVSSAHGAYYLNQIHQKYPYLLQQIDTFKQNDRHGSPVKAHYTLIGAISPSTVRYVHTLGDLLHAFGPLQGKSIVEIGAGYGGQCLITSLHARFKSYDLYDLPDVNKLITRYLKTNKVVNFQTKELGKISS